MKKLLFICLASLFVFACTEKQTLPNEYKSLIETALTKAGANATEIQRALNETPKEQKTGMCFLIAYMPETDLQTLTADFLLENVSYAYKAREEFAWAKALPDSIFYNDVLPYASLDEQRDNWRKDFYTRFAPMVRNAKDIHQAIDTINKIIKDEVKVEYSTKRKRACQGPHESMEQGLASCTGLSILLTDAFRSVGIPSRIAGTPLWVSLEGNHNWNEVLVDGEWFFTEYYPSGLNVSWFLERAGKGDPTNPVHSVYASSYKPAETYYPLVWNEESQQVPAYNVTQRYINLYQAELSQSKSDGDNVVIGILMFDKKDNKASDNRIATTIEVKVDGKTLVKGITAGPLQDMNDYFKVQLKKKQKYVVEYKNTKGELIAKEETAGNENTKIELSME